MGENRINSFLNANKFTRPVKWKLADAFYQSQFTYLKRFTRKHTINLYGIQRSGNHAFIDFLMRNAQGKALLLNDIGRGQHPKRAAIKKITANTGKEPLIIASRENFSRSELILKEEPELYGNISKHHNIILIRDPYNLFASYYSWNFRQGVFFREKVAFRERIIALWKEYARLYIDWKIAADPTNLAVTYNEFTSNEEYKKDLARRLGVKIREINSEEVPNFGGGSSFYGTLNESGDRRDYNQRFLKFVGDEEFKKIFQDEELVNLSQEIFGIIPNQDLLISDQR